MELRHLRFSGESYFIGGEFARGRREGGREKKKEGVWGGKRKEISEKKGKGGGVGEGRGRGGRGGRGGGGGGGGTGKKGGFSPDIRYEGGGQQYPVADGSQWVGALPFCRASIGATPDARVKAIPLPFIQEKADLVALYIANRLPAVLQALIHEIQ